MSRPHYLAARSLDYSLLLRVAGINPSRNGKATRDDYLSIVQLLQDYANDLSLAQMDVITLQSDLRKLQQENEFLLAQLQVGEDV